MYKYSNRSLHNISECHTDLQEIANEVIKVIDCVVITGHRTEEEQNRAFYNNNSRIKYPNGKHNKIPSLAMDIVPYPIKWDENLPTNVKKAYLNKCFVLAGIIIAISNRLKEEGKITSSIRWGGDWDRDWDLSDQTFNDIGHFEIA